MFTEPFYDALEQAFKHRDLFALITITEHSKRSIVGLKTLLWPDGRVIHDFNCPDDFSQKLVSSCIPALIEQKTKTVTFDWLDTSVECFVEVFAPPNHLIVAGAGHIGEPVAKIGTMLDFIVTVVDDRKAYATKERFPYVHEVVCQPLLDYFRHVPLTDKTFILLLTRGHKYDVVSLRQLLHRDEKPAYIGMIGSQRRIAGVFEQLRDEFPNETFKHIFSPVGLDIGAETPTEIAISIFAEILKVKSDRSGQSLAEVVRSRATLKFTERRK